MKYTELQDEICETLLIELFQSIPELFQAVAPNGFSNSPFVFIYHPTPEQEYNEYQQARLHFKRLRRILKKAADTEQTKSFEEFIKEIEHTAVDEQHEMISIFGDCIWNIFSNNHTVFNEHLESYDLDSWRGSGHFIADVINKLQLTPNKTFDYMDFYMGNVFTSERADLTSVYEFIFKKLKAKNLDWEYSFPRMGLVSFNKEDDDADDIENYNPSEALKKQMEKQQKQDEANKLQQEFDKIYEEEYEKAHFAKPSEEVMAYNHVYGNWPKGHPLGENL